MARFERVSNPTEHAPKGKISTTYYPGVMNMNTKTKFKRFTALAVASGATFTAALIARPVDGADSASRYPENPGNDGMRQEQHTTLHTEKSGECPADRVLGVTVSSENGQPLGTVDNIVIDFENGGAAYFIVAANSGERFRVPASRASIDQQGNLSLSTDKASEPERVYSSNGLVDQTEVSREDYVPENPARRDRYYSEDEDWSGASAKLSWDVGNSERLGLTDPASLIGLSAKSADGSDLGKIQDVLVRADSGEPEFLIVEARPMLSDHAAIVPVRSATLVAKNGSDAETAPSRQASAKEGRQVGEPDFLQLDVAEQAFVANANYEVHTDVKAYLDNHLAMIAHLSGVPLEELPDSTVRLRRVSESEADARL